jgi:hypothetical protein
MSSEERVAMALRAADYLLIAAGAGASADSNLQVLQQMFAHQAPINMSPTCDQVAGHDSFCRSPDKLFGFWCYSMHKYSTAVPHNGCHILNDFPHVSHILS